jgi:hypothetical protein
MHVILPPNSCSVLREIVSTIMSPPSMGKKERGSMPLVFPVFQSPPRGLRELVSFKYVREAKNKKGGGWLTAASLFL